MSDSVIRSALIKLSIVLDTPDLKVPGLDELIKKEESLKKAREANSAAGKTATDINAALNSAVEKQSAATVKATTTTAVMTTTVTAEAVAAGAAATANTALAGAMAAVETVMTPIVGVLAGVTLGISLLERAYTTLVPATESQAEAQERLNKANAEFESTINRLSALEAAKTKLTARNGNTAEHGKALKDTFNSIHDSPEFIEGSKIPAGNELLELYKEREKSAQKKRQDDIKGVTDADKAVNAARERLSAAKSAIVNADASAIDKQQRDASRRGSKSKFTKPDDAGDFDAALKRAKERLDAHKNADAKGFGDELAGDKKLSGARSRNAPDAHTLDDQQTQSRIAAFNRAQDEFVKSLQRLNEKTKGQSTGDAIKAIDDAQDGIVQATQQLEDGVVAQMKKMFSRLQDVELELQQRRQSEAAANAVQRYGNR